MQSNFVVFIRKILPLPSSFPTILRCGLAPSNAEE